MTDSTLSFTNDQWDRNYYHNFITTNLLTKFKASEPGIIELVVNLRLNFRDTIAGVLNQLVEPLVGHELIINSPNSMVIQTRSLFMDVTFSDVQSPFENEPRVVSIDIHGRVGAIQEYAKRMDRFVHTDEVYVHWWFKAGSDMSSIQFTLEDDRKFNPSHYPFIKDADTYIQRFADAQANVLVLLGEPGTGKTSFIRHILRRQKCECYITYDDDIMHDDQFYVNFLSNKNVQYLILEDADLLLSERVKDNNKIMSKILNTSDGLISLKNKKIIFTANLHDKTKLDEALVRPGRCFDVLEFRPLTEPESNTIARMNGIELPRQQQFTLAEIFNSK